MKINFPRLSAVAIIVGIIALITIISLCYSPNARVPVISLSGILGSILVIASSRYFFRGEAKPLESFTFVLISSVVIIMLLFIVSQDSVFGIKIDSMTPEIARFYYEQMITVLVGLFTGFMLGISILWVGFKREINNEGRPIGGTTTRTLTKHTIFLFLLFGYMASNIYFGILLDLSKQIVSI